MSELMDDGIIRMAYEMAMSDELSRKQFYRRANSLLTELTEIRAKLAAMESQNKGDYEYSNEYRDGVIYGYHLGEHGDDAMFAHILMHASDTDLPEPLPVPADKPRITEQDAREIINTYIDNKIGVPVNEWLTPLLNKLNSDSEQVPAVAVADADRFCDAHCTWRDHHPDCPSHESEKPDPDSEGE